MLIVPPAQTPLVSKGVKGAGGRETLSAQSLTHGWKAFVRWSNSPLHL